jgi:hypothetical protein
VRRALAALLVPAALALPACGGGDDASDPERVVRDFVDATNEHDAGKLCDELLSPAFIAKTTGAKEGDTETCKTQLGAVRGLRLKLVEVRRTTVDGDSAKVLAVLRVDGARQAREFDLTRQDGDWKLAGGSTPGA